MHVRVVHSYIGIYIYKAEKLSVHLFVTLLTCLGLPSTYQLRKPIIFLLQVCHHE